MTSKNELYGKITASAEKLSLLQGNAAEIQTETLGVGNLILVTYRELLDKHDTVPLHAWEDLCEANDWPHNRTDPVTHEVAKIKGNNKPLASVKSFNTHVRKYFAKFHHLDVESMTELRKALKTKPDPIERIVKSAKKLSPEKIFDIICQLSAVPGVHRLAAQIKVDTDAKRKLVKKAA